MNNAKVGIFIREIRKEKGFTQKELAEQLGITDKAVSKWERGINCPDISLLEELANLLDVTVLELIKGKRLTKENQIDDKDIIDTMKYSRKNTIQEMKKTYKVCACFIVSIILVLILITSLKSILFEYSIIDMTKQDYWTLTILSNTNSSIPVSHDNFKEELHELIENTNQKIDQILTDQGIYTEDEYNIIKKNITLMKEYLENGKNDNYLEQTSYTFLELLQFYLDHQDIYTGYIDYKEIYKILLKYDNNLGEQLTNYVFSNQSLTEEYFYIYHYLEQPYTFQNRLPYKNYTPNPLWLIEQLYENYNNLLTTIIKVGELK